MLQYGKHATQSASYPELSSNALTIIKKRYLRRAPCGELLETPDEMWQRVARSVAAIDHRYATPPAAIVTFENALLEEMRQHRFTFAGRTIANAGSATPTVPNCVVLHIDDTLKSIFSTLKDAALLQQKGSGIGFPFHLLRPAGEITQASLGVASGPISFLHAFDAAFSVIRQNGRRGANMAVMSVSVHR